MRGKALLTECRHSFVGITPAYAGKSDPNGNNIETGKDHPRVCGEKTPINEASFTKSGSPPRMRGKE